jgi:hypothetical protein
MEHESHTHRALSAKSILLLRGAWRNPTQAAIRVARLTATLCLAAASTSTLCMTGYAAQKAGITFPDTMDLNGKQLHLNGLGLRTKFFFKVYVAVLYIENTSKDAQTILAQPNDKHLKLHFLRDVGADKIREAWSEGYQSNCTEQCAETEPEIRRLNSWMQDMKEGDALAFTISGNTFSVSINGKEIGSISNPAFARNILSIFLGNRPPNAELKEGLLGQD